MKDINFKNTTFQITQGSTHPGYSYFTFDEEEKEIKEKYWNISNGEVIFDVGSSYGGYTLTALAMGGVVYSFEPEKSVFFDLKNNVELNNFSQCKLYNLGLWDSETMVNMTTYAPHWPSQTISGDYIMTTLDKIVENENIENIDWIKIDVEGAEENVIKGALKSIAKFNPKMIIECHTFLKDSITNNIKNLILSIGSYNFEEISRDPCIILYATPKKD